MRSVFALVMVGLASSASAQPAPTAASPVPVPADGTAVEVRAGLGFGRYSEHMFGFDFSSDIQPVAQLAIEGEFVAGRGFVVVQADAGLGTEVDMHARSQGMLIQNNRFRQEIYDGSLRYRGAKRLFFEIGYRFTMQRLHFSDIRDANGNMTLIDAATEVVNVHALEGGLGWRLLREDGSRRQLLFVVGLNRATAENDQVQDEDFSAIGASLNVRATHHWASGFQLEGQLAFRQQGGSDPEQVTVMGMQTDGVWPNNTTWQLLAGAGYRF